VNRRGVGAPRPQRAAHEEALSVADGRELIDAAEGSKRRLNSGSGVRARRGSPSGTATAITWPDGLR